MTTTNDESQSPWRQFVNSVAVLSGVLLAVSEILGLLRHSPYRGIIQSIRDIYQNSVAEGKINLTLPHPKKERVADVETPPPSTPGTPGSTLSGTPTIQTVESSYFNLAPKHTILERRNQH